MTLTVTNNGARASIFVAGIEFRALESGITANSWTLGFGEPVRPTWRGGDGRSSLLFTRPDGSAIDHDATTGSLYGEFDLRFSSADIYQLSAVAIFNDRFRHALSENPYHENLHAIATLWVEHPDAGGRSSPWGGPGRTAHHNTLPAYRKRIDAYKKGGGKIKRDDDDSPTGPHKFSGGTITADMQASDSDTAKGHLAITGAIGDVTFSVSGGSEDDSIGETEIWRRKVKDGVFTIDSDGDWVFDTGGNVRSQSDTTYTFTVTIRDSGADGVKNNHDDITRDEDITITVRALDVTHRGTHGNKPPDLIVTEDSDAIAEGRLNAVHGNPNVILYGSTSDAGNGRVAEITGQGAARRWTVEGAMGELVVRNNGKWKYTLDASAQSLRALDDGEYTNEVFDIPIAAGAGKETVFRLEILVAGKSATAISTARHPSIPLDTTVKEPGPDGSGGDLLASGRLTADYIHPGASLLFTPATITTSTHNTGQLVIGSNGVWNYTLNPEAAILATLDRDQTITDHFMVAGVESFSDGTSRNHTMPVNITIRGGDLDAVVIPDDVMRLELGLWKGDTDHTAYGKLDIHNALATPGFGTYPGPINVVADGQDFVIYKGKFGFLWVYDDGEWLYDYGASPRTMAAIDGGSVIANFFVRSLNSIYGAQAAVLSPGYNLTESISIRITDPGTSSKSHDDETISHALKIKISGGLSVTDTATSDFAVTEKTDPVASGRFTVAGNIGTLGLGNDSIEGTYGTLTLTPDAAATTAFDWQYIVNDSAPAGASTDSFDILLTDSLTHNGTPAGSHATNHRITINISGSNDAPTLGYKTGQMTDGLAAISDDDAAAITGVLTFDDVDAPAEEVRIATRITSTSANPGIAALHHGDYAAPGAAPATIEGAYGTFTFTRTIGELEWIYTPKAEGGLPHNSIAYDVLTVGVRDIMGGTGAPLNVAITVTGANTDPQLGGIDENAVFVITEDRNNNLSPAISGDLTTTDPDSGEAEGGVRPPRYSITSRGTTSIDGDAVKTQINGAEKIFGRITLDSATGAWSFTPDHDNLNALGQGDQVFVDLRATVTDHDSATDSIDFRIRLDGVNDTPSTDGVGNVMVMEARSTIALIDTPYRNISDPDNTDDELIYTLEAQSRDGILLRGDSSAININGTFRQSELASVMISAGDTNDSFILSLTDNPGSGGFTLRHQMNIRMTTDPQLVATDPGVNPEYTDNAPRHVRTGLGENHIRTGGGDDRIDPGPGEDEIDIAAGGADNIIWRYDSASDGRYVAWDGGDRITGFTPGEDRMVFATLTTGEGGSGEAGDFYDGLGRGFIAHTDYAYDGSGDTDDPANWTAESIILVFASMVILPGGRLGSPVLEIEFATPIALNDYRATYGGVDFFEGPAGITALRNLLGGGSDDDDTVITASGPVALGSDDPDTITASENTAIKILPRGGDDTVTLADGVQWLVYRLADTGTDITGVDGNDTIHGFTLREDKLLLVDTDGPSAMSVDAVMARFDAVKLVHSGGGITAIVLEIADDATLTLNLVDATGLSGKLLGNLYGKNKIPDSNGSHAVAHTDYMDEVFGLGNIDISNTLPVEFI